MDKMANEEMQETAGHQFLSPDVDKIMDGKALLVTGGTGSFGKSFIRTLLRRYNLRRLVIFSRDELKQYEMQSDPDFRNQDCLRFFIGDVRDRARLEMAFRGIDYVVHAAAMKHVPAAEYNPFECIRTNVLGAENVVYAAIHQGVKKVLALSTDKAASPINLYGASKLASDKIFTAANNLRGEGGTEFSVVRYGNVVGSRGSVVPFFRKLAADGVDSLPITDERMTRFWITLPQAVNFVLSTMATMRGGELFVPKIPSMRILELAEAIAPGHKTHVIGIRPGEKLHEVMVPVDDARSTLELEDRYIIKPSYEGWKCGAYDGATPQPAPEDFYYSSDNNDDWLSVDRMRELLASSPVARI
ncbi:MAG: UDP-N-acetylglucosamine 4,6-dehydratase (inverting) [Sphingomonadales bacterium]